MAFWYELLDAGHGLRVTEQNRGTDHDQDNPRIISGMDVVKQMRGLHVTGQKGSSLSYSYLSATSGSTRIARRAGM